ncbi:MAG: glycerophosphotransferase, partial [Alphaproteobacteria bacterium]
MIPLTPARLVEPPPPETTGRVCFLYIAQAHQVLHSLSVAVSLAASRPDLQVDVAATDSAVLRRARDIVEALGPSRINWRLLGPGWLRAIRMPEGGPPKLPMLVANARRLAAYDVIVAPERTTAALRKLGVKSKLVYTQHGAGDREGPFEARLGAFDLVFAAGRKQYERMIQEGLVAPENCAIVGYPKFDLVDALKPDLPRLFAEQRPTVLYNPHFHAGLSSWPDWGRQVLDAFAGQTRYNLIFAPHLRLFGSRPPGEVPELASYLGNPAIHMDLGGSAAAIDMTYLRMADVYLGDV